MREWDGRSTLRSLSDALATLQDLDALGPNDSVIIKTLAVDLPDGRTTGFVTVMGPRRLDGSGALILMPSSATFSARITGGDRITYDITRLNDAVGDANGNAQLADGKYVYAVNLIPAKYLRDLTELEEAVVECAIRILGVEDRCYAPIHETLPPDVQLLRYENIAQIHVPRLKQLQHEIRKQLPGLTNYFIANTLRFAGMQFPRSS